MISELSFLIDLLLNHDLPKETKSLIATRIKDVEANLTSRAQPQPIAASPYAFVPPPNVQKQAPSTLAAMARHEGVVLTPPPVMPEPEQVAVIAQTPAAIAAINQRNESIRMAISGAPEKGASKPRKF